MEEIGIIFGKRVFELRKARKLSLENYAEFVDIDYKTLWNIERGKHSVHFNVIKKIVEAEKIPLYTLFLTDEEKNKNNSEILQKDILQYVSKLNNNELLAVKNLLEIIVKK